MLGNTANKLTARVSSRSKPKGPMQVGPSLREAKIRFRGRSGELPNDEQALAMKHWPLSDSVLDHT
jgi:hypothetical protein